MASNTGTLSDAAVALDLNNIRKSLMRMEDSIIFSLIERGQFKMNSAVYEADCAWLRSARRAHPTPSMFQTPAFSPAHRARALCISQARSSASSSSTS